MRFIRRGEEVLPDQLWVADVEAKSLAQAVFPNLPVLQLPNKWIAEMSQAVANLRVNPPRQPARKLLYLLEPIRLCWSGGSWDLEKGELQGVRFWLEKLPVLAEHGWIAQPEQLEKLILRPHPSEPPGKYDALISEASQHWPIYLDQSPSLAAALAWSDIAFGCETQALVAALACGLPAFSTNPPWAPACRLPHSDLYHLTSLV
ncbi:hypothetical protein OAE87_01425 [bacterium]|nr:hypothetical protein [bacterium]